MSASYKKFYELTDLPDNFRTFIQDYRTTTETWRESVSSNSLDYPKGNYPEEFLPIKLIVDDRYKKKPISDVTCGLSPFLVLNESVANRLMSLLTPYGEFLQVETGVDGFAGYRVTNRIDSSIDEKASKLEKFENGIFVTGKVTFEYEAIRQHDMFTVREAPFQVFVSDVFKHAIEEGKFQGCKFMDVATTR